MCHLRGVPSHPDVRWSHAAPRVPAPAPQQPAQDAGTQLPADNAAAAPKTVPPQSPDFYVHVGAYKAPDEAETIRAKIAMSGLDSILTHGKDGYYRVRIGPFRTEQDAKKALGTLRSNDIPGQVTH